MGSSGSVLWIKSVLGEIKREQLSQKLELNGYDFVATPRADLASISVCDNQASRQTLVYLWDYNSHVVALLLLLLPTIIHFLGACRPIYSEYSSCLENLNLIHSQIWL